MCKECHSQSVSILRTLFLKEVISISVNLKDLLSPRYTTFISLNRYRLFFQRLSISRIFSVSITFNLKDFLSLRLSISMILNINLSQCQGHFLRIVYLKYCLNLKDSLSQRLMCFSKTVLLEKNKSHSTSRTYYFNLDFNVDGHGHATWAWASSMGMQHGHATWAWASSMGMQHGHGHATWAWACNMGMQHATCVRTRVRGRTPLKLFLGGTTRPKGALGAAPF